MTRTGSVGALVVGGDHVGLAIARSLAPRGIPVIILEDQYCISSFSRYVTRVVRCKNLRDARPTVDAVLDAGQRLGLKDWVLFPTRDETVAAFSQNRDLLAENFRVTTPAWDTVRWAWDKKNTYELAGQLGIPVPRTWIPRNARRTRTPARAFAVGGQAGGERELLLCDGGQSLAGRYSRENSPLYVRQSQTTGAERRYPRAGNHSWRRSPAALVLRLFQGRASPFRPAREADAAASAGVWSRSNLR